MQARDLLVLFFTISFFSILISCQPSDENPNEIAQIEDVIKIDGIANEKTWKNKSWRPLDQRWLGPEYSEEDFSGRYKISWGSKYLYVLAEIKDDLLIDIHSDGLDKYWDDDCLEIFVDENNSKGLHQFSHNAFAYHIALDGKVVDFSNDSLPHYYDHVINKRVTKGNISTWECAVALHNDKFEDGKRSNPVKLVKGKRIGFALAYCDNDSSKSRENFIGSVAIEGQDKNRGYIDAGVFREMKLVE